jgi:hypothetical protein
MNRRSILTLSTAPMQRWGFLLLVTLAAAAATPSWGQTVPDFSGLWAHPSFPSFEAPASGPSPLVNKSRMRAGPQRGRSAIEAVGDYSNPILKPQAAEIVKKYGEMELSGRLLATPRNQCWPEPPPFIFLSVGMQMLQQPDKITILYLEDHEVRHVRMNGSHPAQVTPSWYGDSIGHYEGDTLVIDTVGIKADGPFAMVDWYGTPFTQALHVVERYQLLDYEAAKGALERDAKENFQIGRDGALGADVNYRGKHLQLQFTVEDEGVFTTPWSASITYRPGFNWRDAPEWPEMVCAENAHEYAAPPRADKPDF